jgi:3'-5' exoribonuclease
MKEKKLLNQLDLNTLSKNDQVDHFLVIRKIELRSTRAGKDFLSTELGDKTTSLNASIWEGFAEIAARGKIGDVVKVTGTIEEYQGNLQIRVASVKLATHKDNVSPRDFLPESKQNLDEMKKEFDQKINSITNNFLAELLKQIFTGETYEKFCNAPAG